jgi:hypothetical protein
MRHQAEWTIKILYTHHKDFNHSNNQSALTHRKIIKETMKADKRKTIFKLHSTEYQWMIHELISHNFSLLVTY